MSLSRHLCLACLAMCALLLAACGPSNTVRLLPVKPVASTLPTATSPTIAVVRFADNRADKMKLGSRRDSSAFQTFDSASGWVSQAVADALIARGFRVTFADTPAQAVKSDPSYMLTGSITDLSVRENSMTSFETSIRVQYTLASKSKKIITENLNAGQNQTAMPSGSAVDKILADNLRDIIDPMVETVCAKTGR